MNHPSVTLDKRARAFYFGDEARALFGFHHPPLLDKRARETAVVLCPPLGYEGICAYPMLRVFAQKLSAAGYHVLRFDYAGTGDSAGNDAEPQRVAAWTKSVGDAIDEIRALSGLSRVCLWGVRMGATLALAAAAERGDVEATVAWNACASGRAYTREMKMFRLSAESAGEIVARTTQVSADEEAGGFLLSQETVTDLKALDLSKLQKRAANHILLLGRDDVPEDNKLARALSSHGAQVDYRRMPGYAAMMTAPHRSVFPVAVFRSTLEWLEQGEKTFAANAPNEPGEPRLSTARDQGTVALGVREEPLRMGEHLERFAILTEPNAAQTEGPALPLVLFSNTAGNYRIGPNRMYVDMARSLAALGFRVVRVDVSGTGDSGIWHDDARNHPYATQLVNDVSATMAQLASDKRGERFVLAGLCSGAYVAYHAALNDTRVTGIALLNLQTFQWTDEMQLEVSPLSTRTETDYYARRLLDKDAWQKLVRGEVDLRHAFETFRGRFNDVSRAALARIKAELPQALARRSAVARAFDALCERGVEVLLVFTSRDPGIDNLNDAVGPSIRSLRRRPNFTMVDVEGSDHSFTPLWAQAELEHILVQHLATRFKGRRSSPRRAH